ncbi:MAG: NAD-dependent epimerase/dehydratase family protein [Planctomycetia bacterium]|nr:NAD-dependent epimerase/dehydratase family protein [Planctomycetia bacterium]
MTPPDPRESDSGVDCVVTGATGLVGNNVVRLLCRRGMSVRAVVRSAGRTLDGLHVQVANAPLDDERAIQQAIDGAAAVIHSAALVHCGWRHRDEMRAANVEGTRRVARAARRAGARMVHVSSVDAIGLTRDGTPADEETPPGGMPECPYVVTKREAEQAVLEEVDRGLDAVIVNPVYMIGPWDWKPSSGRMLLEVGAGKGLFAPPGANDFVDVRDVAEGILLALAKGRPGRRYILGGHPLSYLDAWRIFARVAGRMQPLGVAPRAAVRVAGWVGDVASLFTTRELPVNSAAATMSMLPHNFSSARAIAELGYAFRSFDTTVADAWGWFTDHGYARVDGGRTVPAR